MPDDPREYLNSVYYSMDPLSVSATINSGITLARTNALAGLGAVINASTAVHNLINPASHLFGQHALTTLDAASTLSSLSVLRGPYDALNGLAITEPFRATMSSLASVANVAESIRSAYGTLPLASSLPSVTLPPSTVAFGLGVGIASPYLASAASVYSMESSFARLQSSMALSAFVLPSGALPGVSLESLTYLQNGIASVASAAQTAWDALRYESTLFAGSSLALLRSPAVELYTTAHLAGAVTLPSHELPELDDDIEEVLDDTVDELEPRLAALDHDLVEVYRGAVAAICV